MSRQTSQVFSSPMRTYNHLIGIPYDKMNCWDIAVKFYGDILDISLFGIYDGPTPNRLHTKALIYSNLGDFEEVEIPQFGDLVVIRIMGLESHIAIYLGEDKILHTSRAHGSVIDRLSRFKTRLSGFYRVREDDKDKT